MALQIDDGRLTITSAGEALAGQPLRDDALFEIGSITKTFTALLLADAVVRKQLALGDAVEDALPDVELRDSTGAPIRWVDLATHRSGLPRLPSNLAPDDDPYARYDAARLLDFLRSYRSTVPRDTRWEYSNLGFGLLGYALARREKTTYPELLAARVLQPLGMKQTALATPGRDIAGLVQGHDAQKRPVPHWHLDVMMSAGALVMPAADLARYAQAPSFPPAPRLATPSCWPSRRTRPARRPSIRSAWPGCARRSTAASCSTMTVLPPASRRRCGSIRGGGPPPCSPTPRSRSMTWRCTCSMTASRT